MRTQGWMKALVLAALAGLIPVYLLAQAFLPATFEDVDRKHISDGYWNGSDGSGEIRSGTLAFKNAYNPQWGSWSGFALSTKKDTWTKSWENQYCAITGEGFDASSTYAVGYQGGGSPELVLDVPQILSGLYVTNTTYAYGSMEKGDDFAKKFEKGDWFRLTIEGRNAKGEVTGRQVVYLADFRSETAVPYILDTWKWVDLHVLGSVNRLVFSLESSDVGSWGMNTPAYFALDNVGGPRKIELEDSDSSCFINSLGL